MDDWRRSSQACSNPCELEHHGDFRFAEHELHGGVPTVTPDSNVFTLELGMIFNRVEPACEFIAETPTTILPYDMWMFPGQENSGDELISHFPPHVSLNTKASLTFWNEK